MTSERQLLTPAKLNCLDYEDKTFLICCNCILPDTFNEILNIDILISEYFKEVINLLYRVFMLLSILVVTDDFDIFIACRGMDNKLPEFLLLSCDDGRYKHHTEHTQLCGTLSAMDIAIVICTMFLFA